MQRSLLLLYMLLSGVIVCSAQFKALQKLPWYPATQGTGIAATNTSLSSGNVLDDLNVAFNEGRYSDVVYELYPRAVREGYKRNSSLYNNTRRALRQLLREDATGKTWNLMRSLYAERFSNIGRDPYLYVNNLEGNSWCDEQLQNEYLFSLASQPERYREAYSEALRRANAARGSIDLAVILQGMFAPLNRANVAHPELSASLSGNYMEILRLLDVSEVFMTKEHSQEFITFYSQDVLAQVRQNCARVIENVQSDIANREHQEQEKIDSDYALALSRYRQHDYADAYDICNSALRRHNTAELHILKSNILQAAASQTSSVADRVAYWCAAYEAGRGYSSNQVQNNLIEALRTNLFMSGLAGRTHRTSSALTITQRIWTLDELKAKSGN